MTRKSSCTPQHKSNVDHSIGIREEWYAAFHYCKADLVKHFCNTSV